MSGQVLARRVRLAFRAFGVVVAVAVVLAGCSSSASSSGTLPAAPGDAAVSGTLNGSGSTFQLTFQGVAISSFTSVEPSITVNYDGVGSGDGRADLAANSVSFAGSDSPIPAAEQAGFKGKTVLYFPVVIGLITLSYNLAGVHKLRLSAPVIAGIFSGAIKTWNDPAIEADNPGVSLPSLPITLAVRADSSGTTANFTKFLEEAAGKTWKLGSDSTITWPAGSRASKGNAAVAQVVKSTPGAIGYVDYATAKAAGLTFATVENRRGVYLTPSPTSAAAAASQVRLNRDLTFSSVWARGANSYPITYQSWVLVYAAQPNAKQVKMLRTYIGYLLGAGQELLPELGYAPLPAEIDQRAQAQLSKIGG